MKYSTLTYYLLAILCTIATSCVSEGVIDDYAGNNNHPAVLLDDAHINFVLTFPETTTRGIADKDDGMEKERKIDDIQIYTFQNDQFVEKIKYLLISGVDGARRRIVEGKLSDTYILGLPMEFVVIVNAENKKVPIVSMQKGDSKQRLYEKLIFNYEDSNDWSEYIPMWGVGEISEIKNGTYNIGNLILTRAIAKVNITVNNGEGIDGFEINEIILHNYNTQGLCAPLNADGQGPFIPGSSVISGKSLSSGQLSEAERNRIENRFYIPEHQNIGVSEANQLYLTIKAKVKKQFNNTYTLRFTKEDGAYDVLRNNLYIFNITKVTMDDVSTDVQYEVKKWEEVEIDVPSFN